jgi:hypothetical protein
LNKYAYIAIPLKNVDKLHQEGIKGKGVTIGIIDTGEYSLRHAVVSNAGYKASITLIPLLGANWDLVTRLLVATTLLVMTIRDEMRGSQTAIPWTNVTVMEHMSRESSLQTLAMILESQVSCLTRVKTRRVDRGFIRSGSRGVTYVLPRVWLHWVEQ